MVTTTATNGDSVEKPRKRARVALACQRCKQRKQKCDGQHPTCTNCKNYSAQCQYIIPPKPLNGPTSREQYFRAMQNRVAELEAMLERAGIEDEGRARWEQIQQTFNTEDVATGDTQFSRPLKRQSPPPSPDENSPHSATGGTAGSSAAPVDGIVEILRDLSLEASGGFIGASSTITMGRMIGSIVKGKEQAIGANGRIMEEHLSPKSLSGIGSPSDATLRIEQVPVEVADRLLRGYMKHISVLWPFLRTSFLHRLHESRGVRLGAYESAVLHLVYACGGRYLETTGETGSFYSEQHYTSAMRYTDEVLQYHDIRSIQVLLLLAIYTLRAPKGPGAWTYLGLAMRLCIDLGLHRRLPTLTKTSPAEAEMQRRVFWSCYCLDRQISIILGRPFAISDRDIDVELPCDIDESDEDPGHIERAQTEAKLNPGKTRNLSTTMSCFIHITRLRIIESNIQQTIYRVDRAGVAPETEFEHFLNELELWKESIPEDAKRGRDEGPRRGQRGTPAMDGYCYYMVYYYKCLRFLLHPHLSSPTPNTQLIQRCADACGGVCQVYKRLHQDVSVGFSLMALHSIFLAGLTLMYCTWVSPRTVFSISACNDMNACSIVLYIITERWPGARKYRDIFETIKQHVVDSIEEGKYEPRRAIKKLRPTLRATLQTIESRQEDQEVLTAMVSDMAGGPASSSGSVADGTTPPAPASLGMVDMGFDLRELGQLSGELYGPDLILDAAALVGMTPGSATEGRGFENGFIQLGMPPQEEGWIPQEEVDLLHGFSVKAYPSPDIGYT